ncbi:S1 RNA-binding domain-containing protein [Streptomyces sp. NPDC055157]
MGQTIVGRVTKLVPFGAFVRIEERENGFEGLVHNSELDGRHPDHPQLVVQVGDALPVKILDIDRSSAASLSRTGTRSPPARTNPAPDDTRIPRSRTLTDASSSPDSHGIGPPRVYSIEVFEVLRPPPSIGLPVL